MEDVKREQEVKRFGYWRRLGDGKLDGGLGGLSFSDDFSAAEVAQTAPQIEKTIKLFSIYGRVMMAFLNGYELVLVDDKYFYVYVDGGPGFAVRIPHVSDKKRTNNPKEIDGFEELGIHIP